MNASSNTRLGERSRFAGQGSGMVTSFLRLSLLAMASFLAVALGGCGDVESCKRGEVGCLDGPVDALTQKCKFGLVPNAQQNCVKPAAGDCKCTSGQVCRSDGSCVNPCDLPSNLPVKKIEPGSCRPVAENGDGPFDYMTALTHACEQDCIRRQEYCGVACDMSSCAPGGGRLAAVVAQATTAGGCAGMNADCMMRFCETIRDTPCASYACGTGAPNCAGISCANTCPGFTDFVNDGVCDDGDLSNATSAVCPWGTDCGDCGPRRGSAPTMRFDYGDICVDSVQCGGDLSDVNKSNGWCVRFDSASFSALKCVPDCSAVGKGCAAGFTCKDLVFEGEDGSQETLTDTSGKTARACFPMMCGN